MLNPNGFLNILNDSRLPSKVLEKWDLKKRINFIWVSYLVTISPTTVLLFPHVIVGRYPREINEVENTEEIYKKYPSKVNNLIVESENVLNRIKKNHANLILNF